MTNSGEHCKKRKRNWKIYVAELLENEGMLGYLEFAAPKLSEVWICLPFGLLCVCVVIIVWILHAITFF